jgi:hypothetical protein
MELERSRQGLQFCFRPRCNRTLQLGVMTVQSSRSPKNLCHLDVASTASCREYYMGEGGGFPRVRTAVNLVCPSARGLSQHLRVSRMLN